MKILSLLFYFLAHHGVWSFLVFLTLGTLLWAWRKKAIYIIIAFILAILNVFTGQFANAWFLARFGTRGSAVITFSQQTNSTLNDEYIWDYDVVVKTAEGKDIVTGFSTTTASLYPIRNQILIPPEGERFVVKYIPGFEKNIAIMVNESPYGKRLLVVENKQPLIKAERQYQTSENNAAFREEYREAIQTFIDDPENAWDSISIRHYREVLRGLP